MKTMLLRSAALLAGLYFVVAAQAQEFPSRPVKLVVPFSAGGATDTTARLLGAALERQWKQPVVVENRPGGGQVVGAEAVKNSAADGYTMLMSSHHLVFEDLRNKDIQFNLLRDLTPVATVAGSGYVLTIPGTASAKSLAEFIARAKASPGKITEGTIGGAAVPEIAGLWQQVGVEFTNIPYKGGANIIAALSVGEVDLYSAAPLDVIELAKAGRVRPLAYTETTRHPLLPNVPTVAESNVGANNHDAKFYFAISVPNGTPASAIGRANAAVNAAISSPELTDKLRAVGLREIKSTPEEARAQLQRTRATVEGLLARGLRLQ